mgnify:CR=1 FL=1
MATLTKEMKIFSYQTSPVVGWEGEYGGFSLELFGNGNLRYCTYKLFDDIQLMQMFKVDRDTVYGIYELIQETKEEIGEIPRNLDNGSHEGWINEFHLLGRKRSWLEILRHHCRNLRCSQSVLITKNIGRTWQMRTVCCGSFMKFAVCCVPRGCVCLWDSAKLIKILS